MILVRDVFQLKFGKAKEAKALWKEAEALAKKYGYPQSRALTDLTGGFYTFVVETSYKNLAEWENSMSDPRGAEEWGKWYERFAPLLAGGHREMLTIVD